MNVRDIKSILLQTPDKIIELLDMYGFNGVKNNAYEIRFGIGEGHNPNAARISLKNNPQLYVNDFVRSLNTDIFAYIMDIRNVTFRDVIMQVKRLLGIENIEGTTAKKKLFGGWVDRLGQTFKAQQEITVYPDGILNNYLDLYSRAFMNDGIDCDTQDIFNIRYDAVTQRIVFPIYTRYGEIMGVKGRANYITEKDDPKYLYLVECPMRETLYGYSQNYRELFGRDVYVFEAEKSVMQCYSFGCDQAVAVGCHSLSDNQADMLFDLHPTNIYFMFDKGLDIELTKKAIEKIAYKVRLIGTKIYYWDWHDSTLPDKSSPTDYGKEVFKNIIDTQMIEY